MRNLIGFLLLAFCGVVLVARYVAPDQPELRSWYRAHACPLLDRISPEICEPLRRSEPAQGI